MLKQTIGGFEGKKSELNCEDLTRSWDGILKDKVIHAPLA